MDRDDLILVLGAAIVAASIALHELERRLRRERPDLSHGRQAPWRHPGGGPVGALCEMLANSRWLRAICALLPVAEFRSDITDVVYVNYVVPTERLTPLVPEGLELQRIGDGRWSLFTFLTYRHGHFGPAMTGPLRALFGSPVQTNWRIYVRDPRTGCTGVYFVTMGITSWLQGLGARLMAEGLPMHLLSRGEVTRDDDGTMHVIVDPGRGSGPDVEATLSPVAEVELPPEFRVAFGTWNELLAYDVPQDRAMSTQAWARTTTREEIDLGITLSSCEPLVGEVRSRAAEAIVGDATPVCFRVPSVPFRFVGEVIDPW